VNPDPNAIRCLPAEAGFDDGADSVNRPVLMWDPRERVGIDGS